MSIHALCIHGHFYQPPREDPFTGEIPPENGAEPYTNWNERIHAECYQPNAAQGNFGRISFNMGPTLCTWMHQSHSDTCQTIISQDLLNVRHYGVGNAMAQSYNHTILPLATRQDKITQVYWGIKEFEYRMGRKPRGMWLPETAVDLETLEVLAAEGIEFTILAPWQAKGDTIDPTEPYRVNLPSGKSITVFFYHRELSSGVSFNPSLTVNADRFVENEILACFNPEKERLGIPQILLIASDGELYGHHQIFRDRFLAHLVNGASSSRGVQLMYPELWLKSYPVRKTIEIHEFTSWSCLHGVIRWKGTCPCTPGDGRWKIYLRQACDHLAQELDSLYVDVSAKVGIDPWQLRNQYISVLLGTTSIEQLIQDSAGHALRSGQVQQISLLLKAQYERQRMYTSCGWFFEDFSRIEPRNNLAYAARAIWLSRQALGIDLSERVMEDLKYVVSHRNGTRGDVVLRRYLQRAEELQVGAKKTVSA